MHVNVVGAAIAAVVVLLPEILHGPPLQCTPQASLTDTSTRATNTLEEEEDKDCSDPFATIFLGLVSQQRNLKRKLSGS